MIQPNGRIVAVGHAGPHEGGTSIAWRFVLARYLRNGTLDPAWGGDGKVTTFFEGGAFAHGAAGQADDHVVVVGGSGEGTDEAFALAT